MIRVSNRRFDELVREAMDSLPQEFQQYMRNLAVEVRARPDAKLLAELGMEPDELLMGLYTGVPLTEKSVDAAYEYPERILLFKDDIEEVCDSEDDVVDEVYHTVLHEVGHHFGLSEEDLDELGYQ